MKKFLFILLTFFFYNGYIYAADVTAKQSKSDSMISAGSMWQTIIALAITIAIIFAVAWIIKRLNPQFRRGGYSRKIINQIALGPKERIVVVELENQKMIVGVTSSSVTLLKDITDAEPEQFDGENSDKKKIDENQKDKTLFEKLLKK